MRPPVKAVDSCDPILNQYKIRVVKPSLKVHAKVIARTLEMINKIKSKHTNTATSQDIFSHKRELNLYYTKKKKLINEKVMVV